MNRLLASILCFLLAMPLFGSGKKWTQAGNMGFSGPVKSVSTTRQTFMQQPMQPAGSTVIYSLTCGECEFDTEGHIIKREFGGAVERQTLDGQGRVQEDTWEYDNGETTRNVYMNGPSGWVQQSETYSNGKLYNSAIFWYDDRGNEVGREVSKPDGTSESRIWRTFDKQDNELESISDGPGNVYYDVVQTYNQKTGHLESFTSLNRDGTRRLSFTVNDMTVLSYWQQPGDERTYGSDMCFDDDNGTSRDCREYNSDGTYTTTHYSFTDKSKRNPVKATLYGTDHQVVMEADYDYELDSLGNWTKRTIWVQTHESGERKLLEKDSRTLTYYGAEITRQQ